MIKLIWAMDKNNLIGKDNKIPWHIKEDLLYYKKQTAGQTVFMGLSTYYSLKGYYKTKPLPYGKIYVASLDDVKLSDAIVIKDAVTFFKECNEDLFVVGGASIYKLSLPYADMLYISIIKGDYEGDAYFPKIDFANYELISSEELERVTFNIYKRK